MSLRGTAETSIDLHALTSYYLDDTTPPQTQCTGDPFAYLFSQTMSKEGRDRCLDVLLLPRTMVANVTSFGARPT